MSERQRLFAVEYVKDFDANAAALRAGYRKSHLALSVKSCMECKEVLCLIDELKEKGNINKNNYEKCDKEKVLQEICEIAFIRSEKFDNIKISASNKLKALEILGRHYGIFKDEKDTDEIYDDGFLNALSGSVSSDWGG